MRLRRPTIFRRSSLAPRFVSLRRWLLVLLSFAATIGVSLYVVAASWPAEEARITLPLLVHLMLAGATAGEIVSRAFKVMMSARAIGIALRFGTAVRTVLAGDFGAAITPARTGAEPARFVVLAEAGVPAAGALVIMFLELFLEAVSLAVIAVLLSLVFHESGRVVGALVGLVGGYAVFVIGLGVALFVLSIRHTKGPPPRWARRVGLNAFRWRRVQRALRQLRGSIAGLRDAHPGLLVVSLVASILHVVFRLATLPIIVLMLAPEVELAKLVLWPLALFYGGIVAPAPGGGGFIEVAYRAALGGTIPAAIFGASLIWWRFYTFYLYILLGAVAAGRTAVRAIRPDEREIEEHHVRHGRTGEHHVVG